MSNTTSKKEKVSAPGDAAAPGAAGAAAKPQGPEVRTAAPDLSRFANILPEGFGADGLRKVGTLTPLYVAKHAAARHWPTCVGFPIGIKILEMKHETDPAKKYTQNLVVVLAQPTAGVLGNRRDGYIEEWLKAGQRIVVPISGALKNAEELRVAASDPDFVYLCLFEAWSNDPGSTLGPDGRLQNTGKGNDMQVVETFIHERKTKRDGMFVFNADEIEIPDIEEGSAAPAAAAQLGAGGVQRGQVQTKEGVPARAVGATG